MSFFTGSFTAGVETFVASLLEEAAIMLMLLVCFSVFAWWRRRNTKYTRSDTRVSTVKSVWTSNRKPGAPKKSRSNLSTASTTDDSDPTAVCDDSSDTETAYSTKSRLSNRRPVPQHRGRNDNEPGMSNKLEKVLEKLDPQDVAVVRALLSSKEPLKEPCRNTHGIRIDPRHRQGVSRTACNAAVQDETENSLRTNLRKLALIETGRIMMVKRISKLGLNSPQLLTDHFSKFGTVSEVFVTHAIDKRADRLKPRVRPASIGFVVMNNAEDAAAALSQGAQQDVRGVMIHVGTYENVNPKDAQLAQEMDIVDEANIYDDEDGSNNADEDKPAIHGGEESVSANEQSP